MRRRTRALGGWARAAALACALVVPVIAGAAKAPAPVANLATPRLDADSQAAYAEFRAAQTHKAFAIAPGGAWAWQANQPSREAALAAALQECAVSASQQCAALAVDGDLVFDPRAWPTLWAPYPTPQQAAGATTGTARGQRLYDLALVAPDGRPTHLAAVLKAQQPRVLIVHFWGSWCGPCRRELPQLRDALHALGARSRVAAIFIQVREPAAAARAWLAAQHLDLPVFDSGARDERDDQLRLADGKTISDRAIAPAFPSTYVLDGHGLVLFAHAGAISDWSAYLPLLRHAAEHTAH